MLIYESVTPEDARELDSLYERYLNSGDAILPWIENGVCIPGYCGVKCLDDGKIVGVMSARPGVDFTCGHYELAREIETQWQGGRLYTIDICVVISSHRKRGIAKALIKRLGEKLIETGCTHVVAELWLRGREDAGDEHRSPVLPLFQRHWGEMHRIGEFSDFYRELDKYGMTCPYCGGGECICGAIVGIFELKERSQ
jgi:GNAT superfamily N-acetyltransferase